MVWYIMVASGGKRWLQPYITRLRLQIYGESTAAKAGFECSIKSVGWHLILVLVVKAALNQELALGVLILILVRWLILGLECSRRDMLLQFGL